MWLMIMVVEMVLLFLGAGLMAFRFFSSGRKPGNSSALSATVVPVRQTANRGQRQKNSKGKSNTNEQPKPNYVLAAAYLRKAQNDPDFSAADCNAGLKNAIPGFGPS